MTKTFTTPLTDQELQLDTLATISGGGKKAGNVHQTPGEEAPGPNVWY